MDSRSPRGMAATNAQPFLVPTSAELDGASANRTRNGDPHDDAGASAPGGSVSASAANRFAPPLDPSPVSFVQDIDGAWFQWTVVELDAGMVPGSRGARCLIFARQECIRRVWDFPSDWRTLDAAGLLELSWHR